MIIFSQRCTQVSNTKSKASS